MLKILVVVLLVSLAQTVFGALLGIANSRPWTARGIMDMVYIGGGLVLGWAMYGH